MRPTRLLVTVLVFAGCVVALPASDGGSVAAEEPKKIEQPSKADAKAPSYKTDVAPLLSNACSSCHSGKKKKAGFDVESYDSILRTVKAGEPDKSRLYKSLVGKGAKPMPPKNPLSAEQIDIVKAWIAAGAKKD